MSVQKWPQVMVFCCKHLLLLFEKEKRGKEIEKKMFPPFSFFLSASRTGSQNPGSSCLEAKFWTCLVAGQKILSRWKPYFISKNFFSAHELAFVHQCAMCAMLESHAMEVSTNHNSALQFQLQRCTLARKNTQVHKEVVPGFNSDHDIQSVN